jgi:hypothetical protein
MFAICTVAAHTTFSRPTRTGVEVPHANSGHDPLPASCPVRSAVASFDSPHSAERAAPQNVQYITTRCNLL